MLSIILGLIIGGLIIGALGRLAIPGPNPMSIGMTIAVGIGGSFVGAIVGVILFGRDHPGPVFILEVLAAAGIVYLMQRREHNASA